MLKHCQWHLGILAVLIGIMWLMTIPIFQAPDEPARFYYVQYLAERKQKPKPPFELPAQASPYLDESLRFIGFENIIHTRTVTFDFKNDSKNGYFEDLLANNPYQRISDKNYLYDSLNYPPLYFLLNVPIYWLFDGNLIAQLYGMRFLSLAMFVAIITMCFWAFRIVLRDKLRAFFAATTVAAFPMFTFINVSLNNDVLLNLLFAAFFALTINYFSKTLNWSGVLYLAGVSILLFLTKPQSWFLAFFVPLFFILRKKKISIIRVSLTTFGGILLAAIVLKKQILYYYDLLSKFGETNSFWELFWLGFGSRYSMTFKGFFARFGWLDTLVDWRYYLAFGFICAVSAILVVWYVINNLSDRLFLYLLMCTILVDLGYAVLFIMNGLGSGQYSFPSQGRYYFFIILPISVVFFKALEFNLKKIPYYQKLAFCIIAVSALLFNIASLIQFVIPRFYV